MSTEYGTYYSGFIFSESQFKFFFVLTLTARTQTYSCANFKECSIEIQSTLEVSAYSVRVCSSCSNDRSCFPISDSLPIFEPSGKLVLRFEARNMALIPKGVYSVCGRGYGDGQLFTLRIRGIETFQVNYCYDRVPCSIDDFQGDPLPEYGNLTMIPFNSSCDFPISSSLKEFPNHGFSYSPVSNGTFYSFGPDPINLSSLPTQYRVCWLSPLDSVAVPSGTIIIQSFEFYYRHFIETSPTWQPYDSPIKIYILSTILFLAIVAAVISPIIIGLIKKIHEPKRRTELNIHPIIARMCDNEVDEDTSSRLESITKVSHPGNRMQTRTRRSELAFKIFSVSELS